MLLKGIQFILLASSTIFLQAQSLNQKCNCCETENNQFDFWIGKWEVSVNGKRAGINTITKEEGGCYLKENWISANQGFTGSSINFYDRNLKQWRQIWIDNQGGKLELFGNFYNREMILSSLEKIDQSSGDKIIDRITWTYNRDGTVRQHWEKTKNGGKEWFTVFDGLYQKINTKPD